MLLRQMTFYQIGEAISVYFNGGPREEHLDIGQDKHLYNGNATTGTVMGNSGVHMRDRIDIRPFQEPGLATLLLVVL